MLELFDAVWTFVKNNPGVSGVLVAAGGVLVALLQLIGVDSLFTGVWKYLYRSYQSWSERREITKDLPVEIGDARGEVRERLGEPQEGGGAMDIYYADGLAIYYDIHTEDVDGFLATPLRSGVAFDGTIHGVSLGDDFADARSKLGRPVDWGLPYEAALWEEGEGRYIIAYIRRNPEHATEEELGTIRALGYCTVKSFMSYEAVVSIAVEQIRDGQRPSRMEEMAMVPVNLEAKFFQEPYNILGVTQNIMGGANAHVAFGEEKCLVFWLYPQRWEFPMIRAIYDRENPKIDEFVEQATD